MTTPANSYATDGICHAAPPGSFNHECGKPAQWVASKASGFASGFCTRCKDAGIETAGFIVWTRLPVADA